MAIAPYVDQSPDIYSPPSGGLSLSLVSVVDTITTLKHLRKYCHDDLVEGLDFGVIPGTGNKKVLLQPGAQKIAMLFNSYATYEVRPIEMGGGHVEYIVTASFISRSSGAKIGEGIGSCSTMEKKYRYRNDSLRCPTCGKDTLKKSKPDKPGFYCWSKLGGCGATFGPKEPSIVNQQVGQIENPDIADVRNTVLKIAKKRANVDGSLALGCVSDLFTQDLDDQVELPASVAPEARQERQEERPREGDAAPAGVPKTGGQFFAWLKAEEQRSGRQVVDAVQRFGSTRSYPARVVDWDAAQVDRGFRWVVKKLSEQPDQAPPADDRKEAKAQVNQAMDSQKGHTPAALRGEFEKWGGEIVAECKKWWPRQPLREELGLPADHVLLPSTFPLYNHLMKWCVSQGWCQAPEKAIPATVIPALVPIWDQKWEAFNGEVMRYVYEELPARLKAEHDAKILASEGGHDA
jgi:hypothetical protein